MGLGVNRPVHSGSRDEAAMASVCVFSELMWQRGGHQPQMEVQG